MIENNQVLRVLHVSTGAAATATPPGSYSVTRKELRSWSVPFQVWLPYASYFVGGIAFHGTPRCRRSRRRTGACGCVLRREGALRLPLGGHARARAVALMRRRALVAAGPRAAAALGAGAATASAAPATGTPGTLTVALNLPSDGFQVGAVQGRTVVAARGFEIDLTQALQAKLGLSSLAMLQEPVLHQAPGPGPKPWDMAVAQATITRRAGGERRTSASPTSPPTRASC